MNHITSRCRPLFRVLTGLWIAALLGCGGYQDDSLLDEMLAWHLQNGADEKVLELVAARNLDVTASITSAGYPNKIQGRSLVEAAVVSGRLDLASRLLDHAESVYEEQSNVIRLLELLLFDRHRRRAHDAAFLESYSWTREAGESVIWRGLIAGTHDSHVRRKEHLIPFSTPIAYDWDGSDALLMRLADVLANDVLDDEESTSARLLKWVARDAYALRTLLDLGLNPRVEIGSPNHFLLRAASAAAADDVVSMLISHDRQVLGDLAERPDLIGPVQLCIVRVAPIDRRMRTITALLQAGADVESSYLNPESMFNDFSLLDFALTFGTADELRLLLDHSASLASSLSDHDEALELVRLRANETERTLLELTPDQQAKMREQLGRLAGGAYCSPECLEELIRIVQSLSAI